jgi:CubicO group peptidase (beta-lactamase class C family)
MNVTKEKIQKLEERIPKLMERNEVIGCSITLIHDGKIDWSKGFGSRDIQNNFPITKETVFEIASLSKPVVSTLALILVEKKLLDLAIPLEQYIGTPQLRDQKLENLITTRHILTHSTGFPNWGKIRGSPGIFFSPGERFSYSGEGFMYLQKAIETITGKDLETISQELLFKPLGIKHASFLWRKDIEQLGAIGYLHDKNPKNMKPFKPTAAGSLHISSYDYARFLQSFMIHKRNRKPLLSNRLMKEMLLPQIPVSDAGLSDRHQVPKSKIIESEKVFWGLGWGLEKVDNKYNAWHWGNNRSFQHIVFWNSQENNGVVFLSNSERVPFIWKDVLKLAFPGPHPGLDWLFSHYF